MTGRQINTERTPAPNSRFAKAGVSCFYDSEVLSSSFVHLMKFSAENPRLRKSAKRWEKVSDFFPTSGAFRGKKIFQTFSQLDLSASGNAFGKLRWLAESIQNFTKKTLIMKNLMLISTLLCFINCIGQNVKIEISNYSKKLDEKTYYTYQYANASYSGSRPTIVFITNKDLLIKISSKLNGYYTVKQEYTDVWILGISDFDEKKISESDKKIIDLFFQEIIKYRKDNNLHEYSLEILNREKIIVNKLDDICRYISCRKIK